MITGRHDEIRYNSLSRMRDSKLVYIIHLPMETGNCAWQMNKRSILRDLLWPIYKSETSNEVWISDTPPPPPKDDHIDRITDCSTRYGRAPAVTLAWDWPREDGFTLTTLKYFYINHWMGNSLPSVTQDLIISSSALVCRENSAPPTRKSMYVGPRASCFWSAVSS